MGFANVLGLEVRDILDCQITYKRGLRYCEKEMHRGGKQMLVQSNYERKELWKCYYERLISVEKA